MVGLTKDIWSVSLNSYEQGVHIPAEREGMRRVDGGAHANALFVEEQELLAPIPVEVGDDLARAYGFIRRLQVIDLSPPCYASYEASGYCLDGPLPH